jgi:predicted RNA-binding protein with PIN domain
MDSNERWRIEEEHDTNRRALDEAEELLNDYRQRVYRRTSDLVDYVAVFYQDLPNVSANDFSGQFEQTVEEYNWEIRKQQQKIEEAREEEQREFNRKMDG